MFERFRSLSLILQSIPTRRWGTIFCERRQSGDVTSGGADDRSRKDPGRRNESTSRGFDVDRCLFTISMLQFHIFRRSWCLKMTSFMFLPKSKFGVGIARWTRPVRIPARHSGRLRDPEKCAFLLRRSVFHAIRLFVCYKKFTVGVKTKS